MKNKSKNKNSFSSLQESRQDELLDKQLDAWIADYSKRPVAEEKTVYDPIVCSKYNQNQHQAIITPDGRIKFASQFFTETVFKDVQSGRKHHGGILEDINFLELFAFQYPVTARRIRKQIKIVTKREARFTETRLDFRSPHLPKYHPMNAMSLSNMYRFHDYITTQQARMNMGAALISSKSWASLYPEYAKILFTTRDKMRKRHSEFFEKTRDWVFWELTTLPWGNQFDDIFDSKVTDATADSLPEDAGFFVK